MTDKKIALEIITPEKLVLQDQVDSVVLPAYQGEIGIWPGHTHLLAQLKAGELKISKNRESSFFAVSGGFAEVHPDKVEVFAEAAEMAQEIDVERAKLAAQKSKEMLSKTLDPKEAEKIQAALRRELMRLKVHEALSRRQGKRK